MKRIGVTLSGGFVRGAAHIGFLKALEYKGLSPSFIAGSSAGALVGFLYAYGLPLERIQEIGRELSWRKLSKPHFEGGLFKLEGLHSLLQELTGNPDISELKIPFAVVVVNLRTLRAEVKREGPSVDYVVASCSVPPLFSPWKVEGEYYVDGGIRNCLPAEVTASSGVEINICSNVNVPTGDFSPDSILDVTLRSSLSSVLENQEWRLKYCDIIVNHEVPFSPFSFSSLDEAVSSGFKKTLEEIEEWL